MTLSSLPPEDQGFSDVLAASRKNRDCVSLAALGLTQLGVLFVLSGTAIALVTDNKTQAPLGGAPGALLMWWICSRRKDKPNRRLATVFLHPALRVGATFQSFVLKTERTRTDRQKYNNQIPWLFLISALPAQVLLVAQVVIGSVLLKKRGWRWVEYMQLLFALDLAFALLAVLIDQWHFPEERLESFSCCCLSRITTR